MEIHWMELRRLSNSKNQANVKLLIVDSIGNAYGIAIVKMVLPSTVSPKLATNNIINTIKNMF